jgi:hypothetical protein
VFNLGRNKKEKLNIRDIEKRRKETRKTLLLDNVEILQYEFLNKSRLFII